MALQRNQIQLSSKNALSLAHCTVGCFIPKLFLHTTPHYLTVLFQKRSDWQSFPIMGQNRAKSSCRSKNSS